MEKILGIVNYESKYANVEGLGDHRTISAVSILGRYRLCDFVISNFTNSNIQNIKVLIKNKPRSLIEHISATNYNINSKSGKIHLLSGENSFSSEIYNTDIAAMKANRQYIEEEHCDYILIAPCNFVYTMDYNEIIDELIDKKADIAIMYQKVDKAQSDFLLCNTLELDKDKNVTSMDVNYGRYNNENISLETYALSKKLFLELLDLSTNVSSLYSFSDIVKDVIKDLKVIGVKHRGYSKCINTLKAYYECGMEMVNDKKIFDIYDPDWPIYTMSNDTCPALYKEGGNVKNSLVGNGCIIEGEVINSIISRNVVVKKGAIIKDSIVLPDAVIGEGADIERAVVDRFATVSHINKIHGTDEKPIYIKKGDRI